MQPIYVPSKERAGSSPTIEALLDEGIQPIVVTYLSERQEYALTYPQAHVIGVSDQEVHGIGEKRNWILRNARHHAHDRVWLLDDDLTMPAKRATAGEPYRRSTWKEVLGYVEDMSHSPRLGASAPTHRAMGWSMEAAMINRRVGQAVLLNTRGPWGYWPYVHEDTDICLQILTRGFQTLLIPQVSYSTAVQGSLQGGCKEAYERGDGWAYAEVLKAKWDMLIPGLVKVKQREDGAVVTRVQWSLFKQEPAHE